ncbi:hypothetical protein Pmani_004222 [Petrolisthes manimaculis]|uniref:Uncharacterized protein n=1 Tax=Petrolisthes manimaculis TaxID=1843537 RepID=A0AAE1UNI2_9EUCA|nr:hypothetical protein Pmani_004222 [Petrolisthes manimaculis]
MPVTTSNPLLQLIAFLSTPMACKVIVASEVVTQPPGPSYLTDSYYYLEDHTPSPGSHETEESFGHVRGFLDRESENQVK